MLLGDLMKKRSQIQNIVIRNKGTSIKVFGSTATGDATQTSDVDFVVEFKKEASLFDLIEIKVELEELLGAPVDVVSENGLKDNEMGNNIRRSAIPI